MTYIEQVREGTLGTPLQWPWLPTDGSWAWGRWWTFKPSDININGSLPSSFLPSQESRNDAIRSKIIYTWQYDPRVWLSSNALLDMIQDSIMDIISNVYLWDIVNLIPRWPDYVDDVDYLLNVWDKPSRPLSKQPEKTIAAIINTFILSKIYSPKHRRTWTSKEQ